MNFDYFDQISGTNSHLNLKFFCDWCSYHKVQFGTKFSSNISGLKTGEKNHWFWCYSLLLNVARCVLMEREWPRRISGLRWKKERLRILAVAREKRLSCCFVFLVTGFETSFASKVNLTRSNHDLFYSSCVGFILYYFWWQRAARYED